MAQGDLIRTGIPGLDYILRGGIPKGNVLLVEGVHRENLTAILSHEVTAVEQQAFALEVTEFLTDTVIVLRREADRRGVRRSLEITKSRGQDYDGGRHTLHITAG